MQRSLPNLMKDESAIASILNPALHEFALFNEGWIQELPEPMVEKILLATAELTSVVSKLGDMLNQIPTNPDASIFAAKLTSDFLQNLIHATLYGEVVASAQHPQVLKLEKLFFIHSYHFTCAIRAHAADYSKLSPIMREIDIATVQLDALIDESEIRIKYTMSHLLQQLQHLQNYFLEPVLTSRIEQEVSEDIAIQENLSQEAHKQLTANIEEINVTLNQIAEHDKLFYLFLLFHYIEFLNALKCDRKNNLWINNPDTHLEYLLDNTNLKLNANETALEPLLAKLKQSLQALGSTGKEALKSIRVTRVLLNDDIYKLDRYIARNLEKAEEIRTTGMNQAYIDGFEYIGTSLLQLKRTLLTAARNYPQWHELLAHIAENSIFLLDLSTAEIERTSFRYLDIIDEYIDQTQDPMPRGDLEAIKNAAEEFMSSIIGFDNIQYYEEIFTAAPILENEIIVRPIPVTPANNHPNEMQSSLSISVTPVVCEPNEAVSNEGQLPEPSRNQVFLQELYRSLRIDFASQDTLRQRLTSTFGEESTRKFFQSLQELRLSWEADFAQQLDALANDEAIKQSAAFTVATGTAHFLKSLTDVQNLQEYASVICQYKESLASQASNPTFAAKFSTFISACVGMLAFAVVTSMVLTVPNISIAPIIAGIFGWISGGLASKALHERFFKPAPPPLLSAALSFADQTYDSFQHYSLN